MIAILFIGIGEYEMNFESTILNQVELNQKLRSNPFAMNQFYSIFQFTAFGYDYNVTGHVENVFYATSSGYPCYVAVESINGNQHDFDYHAANKLEMCKFAERSMERVRTVNLYGKIDIGENNRIVGIEYANTKARFEHPNNAY